MVLLPMKTRVKKANIHLDDIWMCAEHTKRIIWLYTNMKQQEAGLSAVNFMIAVLKTCLF